MSLHPNLCSPSILVCFSTSTYRSPLTLSGLPDTSVGVVLQCNLLKFIDLQILAMHVYEHCIVIMQQAFMHNYIIILINIIIEAINNCTQPYHIYIYIYIISFNTTHNCMLNAIIAVYAWAMEAHN